MSRKMRRKMQQNQAAEQKKKWEDLTPDQKIHVLNNKCDILREATQSLSNNVVTLYLSLGMCPMCGHHISVGAVEDGQGNVQGKCEGPNCNYSIPIKKQQLEIMRSAIKKTMDTSFIGRILRT